MYSGPPPQYTPEDRSPAEPMHYPGDLDLDDPVNLPRSERPPDLPPPMAMLPSNRGMSNYHHDPRKLIGTLSSDVFERRTSTGSEPFSLLICFDATKFVLLSVLTLKETICPRICSKSRLNSAKSILYIRSTSVAQKRRCLK